MKNPAIKTTFIFFFVALISIPIFAQSQPVKPEMEKPLYIDDILTELLFTSRISHPLEELNNKLIAEIRMRRVGFVLTDDNKKEIKKAGGSDELIKAIDGALPQSVKDRIKEKMRLDKIFRENYAGDLAQRKIAIKAGNDFLNKFGNDEDSKDFVEYLKAYLPVLGDPVKERGRID
jgi:hypothetical protein